MKRLLSHIVIKLFMLLVFILQAGCQPKAYEKTGDSTVHYFAVEVNGELCGYSEITETPVMREGKELILQDNNTRVFMNLLDRDYETTFRIAYFLDPSSMRPVHSDVKVDQANIHIHSQIDFEESLARFRDVNEDREFTVALPSGVIIDNNLYYPYLVKDFFGTGLQEKSYTYFNEREQKVEDKVFRFEGMDTLFLAGSERACMRFTEVMANGMVSESWIEPATAMQLRNDIPGGGRNTYLTDYRVKEMISTVAMEDFLFYRVNRLIPEFRSLSYMKIEAEINTVGDSITLETLNFPGQKFDGTVSGNFVKGTFEIEPVRYKGEGAPGFPYDIQVAEDIKKYLEPELLIESDDAEIAQTARYLTRDAVNAWDAAVLLSKWVSDNISGALPGGGSARGTMQMRQAECGGHSRLLAALCRAAGIPARLAVGGMYVPDNNGFFGQHAWTEVYMGEAGWIPMDATIEEIDYIDAGHIRLGEKSTFHPKKMEIVEYRVE